VAQQWFREKKDKANQKNGNKRLANHTKSLPFLRGYLFSNLVYNKRSGYGISAVHKGGGNFTHTLFAPDPKPSLFKMLALMASNDLIVYIHQMMRLRNEYNQNRHLSDSSAIAIIISIESMIATIDHIDHLHARHSLLTYLVSLIHANGVNYPKTFSVDHERARFCLDILQLFGCKKMDKEKFMKFMNSTLCFEIDKSPAFADGLKALLPTFSRKTLSLLIGIMDKKAREVNIHPNEKIRNLIRELKDTCYELYRLKTIHSPHVHFAHTI